MRSSDHTPPDGLPAALRKIAAELIASKEKQSSEGQQKAPKSPEQYGDPVVAEVPLGGITPRKESSEKQLSGDLYIRLEGQISGPFEPNRLEALLASGILTGLEEVSADLNHWTPLAYHPRIVRGRVRDISRVHRELRRLSALPVKKEPDFLLECEVPLCAIVKKPKPREPKVKRPSDQRDAGDITDPESAWAKRSERDIGPRNTTEDDS